MDEVRSAAAQAGMVDVELLIYEAAQKFHAVETPEELDMEWKRLVRPVYDQLGERALSILHSLYSLNLMAKRAKAGQD
jgi:hypothetical protein